MALTIYLSLIFLALYLIGLAIQRWLFWRDRRRMADESRGGGRVIAKVDDLTPGSVKKFWLICQKYRLDAFLINDRGSFHAYVNRCRHMPTPLDFVRDEFISDDGRFLRCYTHAGPGCTQSRNFFNNNLTAAEKADLFAFLRSL